MQVVSSGDAAYLIDNTADALNTQLLDCLSQISDKLDSITTLSVRLTNQFDFAIALIVTIVFCAVCYIILKGFSRF